MKKYFLIAVLMQMFVGFCYSRSVRLDTIYYDNDWKGVSSAEQASFYRVYDARVRFQPQKVYTYYITGEKQGEGWYCPGEISEEDDSQSYGCGECITYYKSGKIKSRCNWHSMRLDGEYTTFYENGQIKYKGTYGGGLWEGPFTEYYENGQIKSKGNYIDSRKDGLVTYYYENGQIEANYKYDKGVLEGEYTIFNKNGSVKEKGEMKDGMKVKLFTTPKAEGYTLIRTGNIDGYKVDHYLEKVRTFRKDNGDFMTFKEGASGEEDETPSYFNNMSLGNWRITNDAGVVMEYDAGNDTYTATYPNGMILTNTSLRERQIDKIKYGEMPTPERAMSNDNRAFIKLPNNGKKLSFVKSNPINNNWLQYEGFAELDENNFPKGRIYSITRNGQLLPVYQVTKDKKVFFANAKDSIISIDKGDRTGTIRYANGDYLTIEQNMNGFWYVNSGKLHRNGGVLTIKNVEHQIVTLITYDNGDKFAGTFYYEGYDIGYELITGLNEHGELLGAIYMPDLRPKDGTMIKANGQTIQYKDGKTEKQILAERQAQKAKENKLYADLCKQYGKNNVDAALSQKPIVGMPEALLKKAFKLQLVSKGSSYTIYRILGWGMTNFGQTLSDTAHLYTVWVYNGRVSDIRYWGNY